MKGGGLQGLVLVVRLVGVGWGSGSRKPRANCSRAGRGRATRAACGKSVGLVAKPFTQRKGNKRAKARVGVGRARAPGRGWDGMRWDGMRWDGTGWDQSSGSSLGEKGREREREKEVELGEYDDNFPQMAQAVMAPRDAEGARAARD